MSGDGGDESWLSSWEQQCAESIEEQPDYEQLLITDTDNSHRKIWSAFQDSATSIAQLYRDRFTNEPGALWLPFQAAAGTVTTLYKESCEGLRRANELGMQCGYQKRNRELLSWAKKKRRNIQREDLLAYLSGKPLPPRPNNHHNHHLSHHRASPRPRNISPPPGVAPPESLGSDADLHTFRDALARSPLSRRPRGSDLCAFITGEIARHCKRPASPSDVTMSSPTHQKRPRYM
ncbi:hypothetical protein ILUMI_09960 [Ignelater luminosus]|uniref:Uncharacterized protein n=1 Tax=Ignelater luminosus TaxID=2038154 RepID=A0A8K0D2X6_IGNLU|nr:hypothetical protein ILUMI_09960 [Ignelater luminosus]